MPRDAAWRVVVSRAERVSWRVERVCDWETPRVSLRDMTERRVLGIYWRSGRVMGCIVAPKNGKTTILDNGLH